MCIYIYIYVNTQLQAPILLAQRFILQCAVMLRIEG